MAVCPITGRPSKDCITVDDRSLDGALDPVRFFGIFWLIMVFCGSSVLMLGCAAFRQPSDQSTNHLLDRDVSYVTSPNHVDCQELWNCMLARQQQKNRAETLGWMIPGPDINRQTPIEYVPQEGDIVITTSCCHHVRLYKLAGTGHPLHVGILVKDVEGELKLLESTVVDRGVTLNPVEERLVHFIDHHRSPLIWIRPARQPLSQQQSSQLTAFAESQHRKGFAFLRSAAFVLPNKRVIKTSPRQWTWFCTELVIEGLNRSSLLSSNINPASILPEDIYHNRKIDLNTGWLPAVTWAQTAEWPTDRPKGAPIHPE